MIPFDNKPVGVVSPVVKAGILFLRETFAALALSLSITQSGPIIKRHTMVHLRLIKEDPNFQSRAFRS